MAKSKPLNVSDLDLYLILEVLPNANDSEIKKAYRKKALKCHPDKNPDDAKAAAEWERLAKALEVLTDATARAAYDKLLKAKKAVELRNRALDNKRRKIKEDLEAREAAAAYEDYSESPVDAAVQLQQEIERLREEGSEQLKNEQDAIKKQLEEDANEGQEETPKLKIRWKAKKGDESNGGYNYELLKQLFNKYGDITTLLVSSKKKGSAIVEYRLPNNAMNAVELEHGLASNPLQITWLGGKPSFKPQPTTIDSELEVLTKLREAQQRKREAEDQKDFEAETLKRMREQQTPSFSTNEFCTSKPQDFIFQNQTKNLSSEKDFENLAARSYRQAEERRKLIEDMEKNEREQT
ncbi:dnaJ homolog subfamily C member 17-like [Anneissia japonica]|uniref:dnaJ homolog subfamily C member 17-like n=1 Tax=Anneissia japonica TaxID=1529436 RepID=UPI0014259203|nr:dnaJ homolog subfamily C member 17-like [Anneissia japonica]